MADEGTLVTGPWDDPARFAVPVSQLTTAPTGGEGIVFRAFDRTRGCTVALKLRTDTDSITHAELARRARAFDALDHPNLMRQTLVFQGPALASAPVTEPDEFDISFSVADWIDGHPLTECPDLGNETIFGYLADIAAGIAALHDHRSSDAPAGLVHRDLKPSNIRITSDERAVIIDYGIARPVESGDMTKGAGTYQWRAPEVIAGRDETPTSADTWGLGAIAYWLFTRTPPPSDPAIAIEELVATAQLSTVRNPRALATHIARLLHPDPRQRPHDLRRWAHGLPRVANRRPPRHVRAFAAAAVATVAVAGVWSVRGDEPDADATTTTQAADTTVTVPASPTNATEPGADDASLLLDDLLSRARSTSGPYESLFWAREAVLRSDEPSTAALDVWATAVDVIDDLPYSADAVIGSAIAAQEWTPSGQRVATVDRDGLVTIHDLTTGADTVVDEPAVPRSPIAWSPDGERFAFVNSGGDLRTSDADGILDGPWKLPVSPVNGVPTIAWSPDGTRLAVLTPGSFLALIDATGPTLTQLGNVIGNCDEVTWSPTSLWVLASCDGISTGKVVTRDGAVTATFGEMEAYYSPVWNADGRTAAIAGFDGNFSVIDAAAGTVESITEPALGNGTLSLHWNPSADLIVVGETTVGRWGAAGFEIVTTDALPPGESAFVSHLSTDGRTLAMVTRQGLLTTLDLGTGTATTPIQTGERSTRDVVWNASGELLAALNDDGTVNVIGAQRTADPALPGFAGESVRWVDTTRLAITVDGTIHVITIDPVRSTNQFGSAFAGFAEFAFQPAGDLVAFGDGADIVLANAGQPADAQVRIPLPDNGSLELVEWDQTGTRLLAWWQGNTEDAIGVFSPTGETLTSFTSATKPTAVRWVGDRVVAAEQDGRVRIVTVDGRVVYDEPGPPNLSSSTRRCPSR